MRFTKFTRQVQENFEWVKAVLIEETEYSQKN